MQYYKLQLTTFSLIAILLITYDLPAQSKSQVYEFSQKKLGLDDLLIYGVIYTTPRINANGTPFFEYIQNSQNALYIKGQEFKNVDIKLDILSNILVLKNPLNQLVTLDKSLVDSFILGDHVFYKLFSDDKTINSFDFYEKIYFEKNGMFKKHKKKFIDSYNNLNPNGIFSGQSSKFYLYKENQLIKINSVKNFLKAFPNNEKAIKKYIKSNKIKLMKADQLEIYNLMNFCNDK